MDYGEDFKKNLVLTIRCFIILIILGIILPHYIERIIFELIFRYNVHGNSTFVYATLNENYLIIYKFIYLFNSMLTL